MSLSKSFKPSTSSEVKAAPLTSKGRQVVLLTCYLLLALLSMDLVRKSIDWYLSGGRLMRPDRRGGGVSSTGAGGVAGGAAGGPRRSGVRPTRPNLRGGGGEGGAAEGRVALRMVRQCTTAVVLDICNICK